LSAEAPEAGRSETGGRIDNLIVTHIYGHMKTTIELPDTLFRNAKVLAARRGTSMRELVIEGLRRVVENKGEPALTGFVLTQQEAQIATIGANGLPVLKRSAGARKPTVTGEFVNRIRDELSI
jgi:hypothetical protein